MRILKLSLSQVSRLFVLFFCGIFAVVLQAGEPRINFLDLDSGPSVSLGDGLGSGTIVTLWGNNLGSAQGASTVKFRSADGSIADAAYVYYWKNADGQLPGGPANLFTSHKMQEIAFSIPDAIKGQGEVYVVVNGSTSNKLNFTVRDGTIKWIAPDGRNKNDCSYNSPCGWINGDIGGRYSLKGIGSEKLSAGDIVYSRGVEEPDFCSGGVCAGMFLRSLEGTLTQPISLVAYPNTRPKITSVNRGVNAYRSNYINISKYYISVGYKDPSAAPSPGNPPKSNYHIGASKGRYIGNYLDEKINTCFNGWSGAITSGGGGGSGAKIFGNHFFDLGCDNASRYQHTLYMSVRNSGSTNVKAWEIGWNHLEDNKSFFGIHNYDEQYSGDCGNVVGTLSIHNNYIINQKGAGIHISTRDRDGERNICWEADISIFNNVLINNGLGPAAEEFVTNSGAIRITGDMGSKVVDIFNNTIYLYSDASARLYSVPSALEINFGLVAPIINVRNNMVYADGDYQFVKTDETFSEFKNNLFHTTANNPTKAIIPTVTAGALADNFTLDPLCTLTSGQFGCADNSPLIAKGKNSSEFDIFGNARGANSDIGAIQFQAIVTTPQPKPSMPKGFILERASGGLE